MGTVLVLSRAEYDRVRKRLTIRVPGQDPCPPDLADIEDALNATILIEDDA